MDSTCNDGGALATLRIRTLNVFSYPGGHFNGSLSAVVIERQSVVDGTGSAAAALVAIHNDGIPTHAGRGCAASGCLVWTPHARRYDPPSRRVQAENTPAAAVLL